MSEKEILEEKIKEKKDTQEYIDKMVDYWDNTKIYEGKKLETIKQAIINN